LFSSIDIKILSELIVFADLYNRGFWVSSGLSYGCDFVIYCTEPLLSHSTHAIKILSNNLESPRLKSNNINLLDLSCLSRLCTTVNKILMYVEVNEKDKDLETFNIDILPSSFVSLISKFCLKYISVTWPGIVSNPKPLELK
jgi:tRNA-intron lyase